MDQLAYVVALSVVRLLQALPLRWVARIGRAGGAIAYVLDARHRKVTQKNLAMCLGSEKSAAELNKLARENLKRIGEAYCTAVKTSAMGWDELKPHVSFLGAEKLLQKGPNGKPRSCIMAIGHFGNFELYARVAQLLPGLESGTTYRALQPPSLNRLMQSLRATSGCNYFERRANASALKAWLAPEGRVLGFLSDQHAGRSGVRVPFFGIDCATTMAPAIFALRYDLPLRTAICFRVGLGQWRIELGDEISTAEHGKPRTVESITRDINRTLEAAVRRDPANWFWVHNRWKPDKSRPRVESASDGAEPSDPSVAPPS